MLHNEIAEFRLGVNSSEMVSQPDRGRFGVVHGHGAFGCRRIRIGREGLGI